MLVMALVMVLTFAPMAFMTSAAEPLPAPANVRITNPGQANQAVAWDAVGGAASYMVYAFDSADETDIANAVGSQSLTTTSITIGSGELLTGTTLQGFTIALPAGPLFFRVRAIAADQADNSDLSVATAGAKPGRRIDTNQITALINDPKAVWNTSGKGFILIDVRTGTSTPTGRVRGNIDIPLDNPTGTNSIFSLASNRNFFDRVLYEVKAHPAYNGPDTLIIIY